MDVLRALLVALPIALAIDAHAGEDATDAAGGGEGLGGVNWDAVGKVSFPNGSYCTGTLVSSKVVVTAAHCLFDEDNKMNDKETSFQAGFHVSNFKTASPVIDTVIPKEFDIDTYLTGIADDAFDYAFLDSRVADRRKNRPSSISLSE